SATACASASASAAALRTFGMTKRRASWSAIAPISSASPAPRTPRTSGAATMLATAAATDAAANAARAMRARRIRRVVMRKSGDMRALSVFRIMLARERQLWPFLRALDRRAVVRADHAPVQLGAQLLGDHIGVDRVADDLRADEDDQLGARG